MNTKYNLIENRIETYELRLSNLHNWKLVFDIHNKLTERRKNLLKEIEIINNIIKKSKILITNTETIEHIDNGEMNLIAKDISNNYKKLPTNKNCARQIIDLIINATIKLQKSIAKLLGFSLYPRIVLFDECE